MSSLAIRAVRRASDVRRFVELPFRLYADQPLWVPPFRADVRSMIRTGSHPLHEAARLWSFLAEREGRVVGRITAIDNTAHNQRFEDRVGFFGFFECEDDPDVGRALLDQAAEVLNTQGFESMRGPLSPSLHYDAGFLVEGFDREPGFRMPYTLRYYPTLMESWGLQKVMDLYAYELLAKDLRRDAKIKRVLERSRNRSGVTLRPLDLGRMDRDLELMRHLYCEAWAANWGFHPMSSAEFLHEARSMKDLAEAPFVLFAEKQGEPVAFLAALRNLNPSLRKMKGRFVSPGLLHLLWHRRRVPDFRVMLAGAVADSRSQGVMAILYDAIIENGLARGIERCEMSWILESNEMMRRSATMFGAEVTKIYRLYEGRIKDRPAAR